METWLMLRGHAGDDWNAGEMWLSDMWTVLWQRVTQLAGVRGIVACAGTGYSHSSENFLVTASTDMASIARGCDMVFHRGGFREFDSVVEAAGKPALYYGAGVRTEPARPELYHYVLRDDAWMKPATDAFYPMPDVQKTYQVCYIANARQSAIKSIDWFYNSIPADITALHLTRDLYTSVRKNVTAISTDKRHMPWFINQCQIGVVPYWTAYDRAPRVIPEMQACGLPLVVGDRVRFGKKVCGAIAVKEYFWDVVRVALRSGITQAVTREWYDNNSSMDIAARTLCRIIREILC